MSVNGSPNRIHGKEKERERRCVSCPSRRNPWIVYTWRRNGLDILFFDNIFLCRLFFQFPFYSFWTIEPLLHSLIGSPFFIFQEDDLDSLLWQFFSPFFLSLSIVIQDDFFLLFYSFLTQFSQLSFLCKFCQSERNTMAEESKEKREEEGGGGEGGNGWGSLGREDAKVNFEMNGPYIWRQEKRE